MAESVVSFLVDKLDNFLAQELRHQHGLSDKVDQLRRELQHMQCFLRDADTRRRKDARVRHWVKEIRDVAYEAEDVIDTFIINAERRPGPGVSGFLEREFTDVDGPHRTSKEITDIMAKISEISASRITYDNGGGGVERLLPGRRRPIVPDVEDSDVVAFDGHMSALVEQLLHSSNRRSVMSIVGTGGLGKTTLAQKVYNSVDVKREFGIRVWISVSQDYTPDRYVELLNEILVQVRKDKKKLEEREAAEKLRDSLKDKRYLIVMDDVWSKDVWDQIREALPDEKNGSRVLITTRDLNVAKYADPSTDPYKLRLLTDEESLELLLKKAFTNQDVQANCPENLRSLGRQLVKFCGNLPLPLVVIGGLLSVREKEYSVWSKVLKTMSWQEQGKNCMDILALSYDHLPHHLKSCFLYLAAFPEDYEIQASKLIRLWIAEGFIPRQDRATFEETAEDCLEELAQRCMVQVVRRKNKNRSISSCWVHDLLREFAMSEAREDGFLVIYNNPNQDAASPQGPVRRAAFHNLDGIGTPSSGQPEGPPPYANLPNLQTLYRVDVPESWYKGLPNITSVRKLGLYFGFQDHGMILPRLLEKLDHLLSLSIFVSTQPRVSQSKKYALTIPSGIDTRAFPCHHHIQSMYLKGRWYTTTVGSHEFPPHLVKLTLNTSLLEHDPMPTLEKLQNLRVLELIDYAYMGKKMICSAGGFPQLQKLTLDCLYDLEEWCVEADAMQKITRVHIRYCNALRVVPEFQRLPNLQELDLEDLSREFMDRISVDGGEDHYKIQNVQSVRKI